MRGRRPSGPEFVERLTGSDTAKERLKGVLETLAGSRRVSEICAMLGISEQRFDQIRIEALQASLERLEARSAGRPASTADVAAAEVDQLKEKIAALEAELRAARARAEIALALPRVGQADAEKKTTRPRHKSRPPRPRKPT